MVLDGIEIKVDKKRIKNIYIRIKPPAGDVVISAPLHMRDEDIYIFAELEACVDQKSPQEV